MEEEQQQQPERLDTTPVNGVVSPDVSLAKEPEPEPVKAEVVEPPAMSRDFEVELAQKDQQLKQLEKRLTDIQGASRKDQEDRQKLMTDVARLVNEREAIEKAKNEELERTTQQLEEVSQATQTLTQKTATLEQQLAEAQAKATKLEIVTSEFPNLLQYAEFIPASTSAEEVRDFCRAFEAKREADLSQYRQIISGGQAVRTVPAATPATRMESFGDATNLEERLGTAMKSGSHELFERELQAAIQNYEARRPR